MLFKNLETDRLYLKNIDIADREFMFSQFSNDTINKYLYDAEPLTDISEADEIIEFYMTPEPRNQHRWVIIRKSKIHKTCRKSKICFVRLECRGFQRKRISA